jgi:hypothetical protein
MRHYTVQYGDSPHTIARRFGISHEQLIAANPYKPVVFVRGVRTWNALVPGERLRVPIAWPPPAAVAPLPAWPPAPVPQVQPAWVQPQPWVQPQLGVAPAWQPAWAPQPQPWPQRHWDRRYGLRGGADTAGVGDLDPEQQLLRHQEQLRRLEWGRRGYEYGGNPYGVAHGVRDAASDAVNALIAAGSPCDPNNAPLVCAVQAALGIGVDGKWGAGTAHAARAVVHAAPPACSPRPAWWAPAGQTNCGGPPPAAGPLPPPPPSLVPPPAPEAPPPPPPPAAPSPAAPSAPTVLPPVVPAPLPTAPTFSLPPPPPPDVLAMMSLDPCDQGNVAAVCAAQAALGIGIDGKWGKSTAQAAQAVMPNAPGPCSPRPSWWSAAGQSNCGGPPPVPTTHRGGGGGRRGGAPSPGAAPPGAPSVAQASMVPSVRPPTAASGIAVAAVLGALGLAGIVALVATGSRPVLVTAPVRRTPAYRHPPVHATHRRAPARRRSRIKRRR